MQYTAENARKVMLGLKSVTRRPLLSDDLGVGLPIELAFRDKLRMHLEAGRNDYEFREVLRRDKRGIYRMKFKTLNHYAIQPGRGKLSLGGQQLLKIGLEQTEAISEEQARLEGFDNTGQFFDVWRALYGKEGLSLFPTVWVLTFGAPIPIKERMHLWAK